MQENSEKMAQHMLKLLQLNNDQQGDASQVEIDDTYLMDQEIIQYATRQDLPMFLGIDGSVDKDGIATITVSIVALDIRVSDYPNTEQWQNRKAKILLTRSWRLPREWGTEKADINMAEAVGFIIGAYTVPTNIPIIFITDSNNAHTLQRNTKHLDQFTHQKQI
jgi:hypothetical protein